MGLGLVDWDKVVKELEGGGNIVEAEAKVALEDTGAYTCFEGGHEGDELLLSKTRSEEKWHTVGDRQEKVNSLQLRVKRVVDSVDTSDSLDLDSRESDVRLL